MRFAARGVCSTPDNRTLKPCRAPPPPVESAAADGDAFDADAGGTAAADGTLEVSGATPAVIIVMTYDSRASEDAGGGMIAARDHVVTNPDECPTATKLSSQLMSMLTAGAGSWCHATLFLATPSNSDRKQSDEAERNRWGLLLSPTTAFTISPPAPSVTTATLPLPLPLPPLESKTATVPHGRPSTTCVQYLTWGQ